MHKPEKQKRMNTNEKYDLADLVIGHALKKGAQQVSVSINENRSTEIEIRDQKTDTLKESNQNGLSVDLYVDKKYSAHSTNRMKKDELFRFVDEAIIATRYLGEDSFRSLPDPDLYFKGKETDLKVFDSLLDPVPVKDKLDVAGQALDEAYKKDERIISVSSYYSDWISNRVLVCSNGFRGNSANTGLSLTVSVSVNSKTGRPSDYWNENALFWDRLKRKDVGRKALDRVLKKMDPTKITSGKYPVIIENRVAGRICSAFFQSLQGSSLYQKQSFLIGKEGKEVASGLLTVFDDPYIPSGFGSRLFDYEGLAAVKRPIVEGGILKNYYIDNYYGRKLNMKPTSGSSSNVVFSPGTRTPDEMVKSLKNGVLITGFIGGNCNGSTGDFSYGIEGFYIKNGEIVHPVNEMNITGNMNTFWMSLAELGNDIQENDSLMIPSLLFDNADLSGI